jgi:glycine betaine/proline transport system substrate-binding protein
MKWNRITRRTFSISAVMMAIAIWGCSSDADPAPNGGTSGSAGSGGTTGTFVVKLVYNPWDTSELNVLIAKEVLAKLDVQAEAVSEDEYKQWDKIASGELHAALEVWPSGHGDDRKNYIDAKKIEDGGALGPVGKIGWHIPTYMLKAHPDLATVEGLKKPENIALFKTPETGDKGRFLEPDPTLNYTSYDAQIIKNLNLNLQVVNAKSEADILSELDSRYAKEEAILFYLWTPHYAWAKYDLTQIELPAYSDACYAKVASEGVDCDYPADKFYKIFWPGLQAASPVAYKVLKAMNYDTKTQIDLHAAVALQGKTKDVAAKEWVTAHESVWRAWAQ